jgi:hypothetical protein
MTFLIRYIGSNCFISRQIRTIDRRVVFIAGSRDLNYRDNRGVFRGYGKKYVLNIQSMSVKNMAHTLPSARYFNEAIAYLDKDI